MKTLNLKFEAMVYGLFPLKNEYVLDGFTFKHKEINIIDYGKLFENEPFLFSSIIAYCCNQYKNKETDETDVKNVKTFYCCFENNIPIKHEISNNKGKSKKTIETYLNNNLEMIFNYALKLEKKLRLITNLNISIPAIKLSVYDENMNLITKNGFFNNFSPVNSNKFSEKNIEKQQDRLRFHIDMSAIKQLEESNSNFSKSLDFYDQSFSANNISLKLICLFSALEALFNIDGENITENIATYTSKIMFDNGKKEETYKQIKKLYNKRSNYVHGSKNNDISELLYEELKEYLRSTLLNYWFISMFHGFKTNKEILSFLDSNAQLELNAQLAIRAIRESDYSSFYADIRNKLEKGEKYIL
jgi:hypothetical protein